MFYVELSPFNIEPSSFKPELRSFNVEPLKITLSRDHLMLSRHHLTLSYDRLIPHYGCIMRRNKGEMLANPNCTRLGFRQEGTRPVLPKLALVSAASGAKTPSR